MEHFLERSLMPPVKPWFGVIAREHRTKLLDLRAATELARMLVERGDDAEAKALLAPVYDWFSGGFDKPDLMEAKAVLDGLG